MRVYTDCIDYRLWIHWALSRRWLRGISWHGNRHGLEDLMRQNWNHIKWNGWALSIVLKESEMLGSYFLSIVMRMRRLLVRGCEMYKYTHTHTFVPCQLWCMHVWTYRRACIHTYVKCRKIINDSKVFYTLHDARTCDCSHGICHSWSNGIHLHERIFTSIILVAKQRKRVRAHTEYG